MVFHDFIISESIPIISDTFLLRVQPKDGGLVIPFSPGMYVHIKNPQFTDPDEAHPFSITSSPNNIMYLEFCIKTYGDWTKKLADAKVGDLLKITGPMGNFIWQNTIHRDAVFLSGGIGIAPVMSMLRFISEGQYNGNYVLLYGNRTPESNAYANEIHALEKTINHLKVVHIFSGLQTDHAWKGERGFITKELLEKEVDFHLKPTFFLTGPPIFLDKMKVILKRLGVEDEKVKMELIG